MIDEEKLIEYERKMVSIGANRTSNPSWIICWQCAKSLESSKIIHYKITYYTGTRQSYELHYCHKCWQDLAGNVVDPEPSFRRSIENYFYQNQSLRIPPRIGQRPDLYNWMPVDLEEYCYTGKSMDKIFIDEPTAAPTNKEADIHPNRTDKQK